MSFASSSLAIIFNASENTLCWYVWTTYLKAVLSPRWHCDIMSLSISFIVCLYNNIRLWNEEVKLLFKKVLTYESLYYGLCHEMILFGLVIFVRILRHTTRRFLCKISEIISHRLMSAWQKKLKVTSLLVTSLLVTSLLVTSLLVTSLLVILYLFSCLFQQKFVPLHKI